MLAIELKLNLFVLAGIVLSSFFLGFMFRRNRINSFKQKVIELEKEMLNNHADILELQKRFAKIGQEICFSTIFPISFIGIRSCIMESRYRIVTVWSPFDW